MKFLKTAFLLPCIFGIALCDVVTDIDQNNKKRGQYDKQALEISSALGRLGNAINNKDKELKDLNSKIQALEKSVEKNKSSQSQHEKTLEQDRRKQKENLQKLSKLESEIIKLVTQTFALHNLSLDLDSKEDVVEREIYNHLLKVLARKVKALNSERQKLAAQINSTSSEISKIESTIQEQTNQKTALQDARKKHEQVLESMQKEVKQYNAKLQEINNERKKLDNVLANLKLIQAQNEKETAKKIEADNKAAAAKKDSAQAQNSAIKPAPKIDIASTSAHKNVATQKYSGQKTIPPLEPNTFKLDQKFGKAVDPVYKIEFFYENIILVPHQKNANVQSVLDGKVVYAKENPVIKKVVIIEHNDSLYTIYAHLDAIASTIKPGVFVKKGYTIGKTSDKLSFEVTQREKHIDPLQLIKIN